MVWCQWSFFDLSSGQTNAFFVALRAAVKHCLNRSINLVLCGTVQDCVFQECALPGFDLPAVGDTYVTPSNSEDINTTFPRFDFILWILPIKFDKSNRLV